MSFLTEDSSFDDLEYEEKLVRFAGAAALIRIKEERECQEKLKAIAAPWAQQNKFLTKRLRELGSQSRRGDNNRPLLAELRSQLNELKEKNSEMKRKKQESVERCHGLAKILCDAVTNMGFVDGNQKKPFCRSYGQNTAQNHRLAEVVYSRYKRKYERLAVRYYQEKLGDIADLLKPASERKAKPEQSPEERMKKALHSAAGLCM